MKLFIINNIKKKLGIKLNISADHVNISVAGNKEKVKKRYSFGTVCLICVDNMKI